MIDHHGRYQDWLAALPLLSPHHWNITCWLSPLAIKIPITIIIKILLTITITTITIIIVTIPSPSTHTGWHWAPRKKQKGTFFPPLSPQFSREKVRFDFVTSIYLFSQQLTLPLLFSPRSLDCLWPSLNVIGFYFLYTSASWPFCGFGMGVKSNCYQSIIYYYEMWKLLRAKAVFVGGISIYNLCCLHF